MRKIKKSLVELLKSLNLSIIIRPFFVAVSAFNRFFNRLIDWFNRDSSSNGDLCILTLVLYALVVSTSALLWCILLLF